MKKEDLLKTNNKECSCGEPLGCRDDVILKDDKCHRCGLPISNENAQISNQQVIKPISERKIEKLSESGLSYHPECIEIVSKINELIDELNKRGKC